MIRSSNQPTKVVVVKSTQIPTGDNVTSGELPFEDAGQGLFGTGDNGKIEHFNALVKPTVTH